MDLTDLDSFTALLVAGGLLAARLLSARFPALGVLLKLVTPNPLPAAPPAGPAKPDAPAAPPNLPLPRLKALRDALSRRIELAEGDAARGHAEADAIEGLLRSLADAPPPP